MPQHQIKTTHGLVHAVVVGDGTTPRPALLVVHGNSSSSKIFHHITKSATITNDHCVIACDLPGHGLSGNADDPNLTYSMGGYASCLLEVLAALSIHDVIILGWSLGGHIALEMIGREETAVRIRGALLVGTPPSSGTQVSQAFLGRGDSPYMHLTSQELWNQDEAFQYAHRAIGGAFEEWQRDDALRTDGRARRFMFQAFETGSGIDQAQLVATQTDALIGVVNGSEEPFISLDYLDSLVWANLWEGHCHRLSGFGHAPFWEAPELFEALLVRFINSCT